MMFLNRSDIEGLFARHKPALSAYDMNGIECEKGWDRILGPLLHCIKHLDPKCQILQIKEKFGLLRVYVSPSATCPPINFDHIHEIISWAEHYSGTVCERCGKQGKKRDLKWMLTLCDDCLAAHLKAGAQ